MLRDARGKMTQEILAERANVSQGWISAVERGEIDNPAADKVGRVAQALGVDERELFAAQHNIAVGEDYPPPAALANLGGKFRDLTPEELKSVEAFAEYIRSQRDKQ